MIWPGAMPFETLTVCEDTTEAALPEKADVRLVVVVGVSLFQLAGHIVELSAVAEVVMTAVAISAVAMIAVPRTVRILNICTMILSNRP